MRLANAAIGSTSAASSTNRANPRMAIIEAERAGSATAAGNGRWRRFQCPINPAHPQPKRGAAVRVERMVRRFWLNIHLRHPRDKAIWLLWLRRACHSRRISHALLPLATTAPAHLQPQKQVAPIFGWSGGQFEYDLICRKDMSDCKHA